MMADNLTPEQINKKGEPYFFGLVGLRTIKAGNGEAELELKVEEKHLAINGFMHAGAVVALADSSAGFGCMNHLPNNAKSFTTIELKCNLIGTVRKGKITASAHCIHAGRTTQVWDSTITSAESGKVIAEFRCTQLILY